MKSRHVRLSVLFVCTANVCRSPMAEAILKHRLYELGWSKQAKIESAGTQASQFKLRVDLRAQKIVSQFGMDVSKFRSRPLSPRDLQTFQYVLVMDQKNLDLVNAMAEEPVMAEVKLLSEFDPERRGEDIQDPYYGSYENFEKTYHLIEAAIEGFVESMGISAADFDTRKKSVVTKILDFLTNKYQALHKSPDQF